MGYFAVLNSIHNQSSSIEMYRTALENSHILVEYCVEHRCVFIYLHKKTMN